MLNGPKGVMITCWIRPKGVMLTGHIKGVMQTYLIVQRGLWQPVNRSKGGLCVYLLNGPKEVMYCITVLLSIHVWQSVLKNTQVLT